MELDPASIGGKHALDRAIDLGLLQGAVSYAPSTEGPDAWTLLYDDERRGRATVECRGFELLTLGLIPQHRAKIALSRREPTKWGTTRPTPVRPRTFCFHDQDA
jgi:hypothetical protein